MPWRTGRKVGQGCDFDRVWPIAAPLLLPSHADLSWPARDWATVL
jgi:hypothetical protein